MMAVRWHWAFGAESAAVLQSHAGFGFLSTSPGISAPVSASDQVYSYSGSPTRYSIGLLGGDNYVLFPTAAVSGVSQGWAALPMKITNGASVRNTSRVLAFYTAPNFEIDLRLGLVSGSNAVFNVYVGSVFRGASGSFDMAKWRYVAVKFDFSTTTHSMELYVDGSLAAGPFTRAGATASPAFVLYSQAGANAGTFPNWCVGQLAIYDDVADAGEVPRYVTRIPPNADGTDVGTWTPSTGSTDWEVVDPPLDTATYSECILINPGDRLEVDTNAGGSDINTALGLNPGRAIDSVMQHAFVGSIPNTTSTWDGHAAVELGGSETAGATTTIASGATRYIYAVANTTPGGGAWAGTDAPGMRIEAD